MYLHRIVLILALVLVLAAPSAHAFFDPPWITPTAPASGEPVSVNIRGGVCDSIFFRPGYPQITQLGNNIHILEYGHHWDTVDLCVYGIGTLTEPVGTFSPGDYTLTVDFIYDDALYGPTVVTLGVIPFTVAGVTSAAPVPTSTISGGLVLLFLLSGSAFWVLWMRRQVRR
jgi:hypothetical protein